MTRTRVLPSLMAAAGLALTSPIHGQQQESAPPAKGAVRQAPQESTVVTLDFRGGTLQEFVAALRAATKDPVNVVLQGEANKISVDPMQLRDVTPEAAIQAALTPRNRSWEAMPDGSQRMILLETVRPDSQTMPVHTVGVRVERGSQPPGSPAAVAAEVFSIQRLVRGDEGSGLAAVPESVVLSAIDAGLKLTRQGEPKPQIEYHKDSGLLLVRGQVSDVRMIQEIIRKMGEDQGRRASDTRQKRKAEVRLEAEIQKAKIMGDMSKARLAGAESTLGDIRELVKGGSVSQTEARNAELGVVNARAEVQMTQVELERLLKERELGAAEGADSGDEASEVRQLRAELDRAREELQALKASIAKSLEGKEGGEKKPGR
jgi:hypothetical protein